MFSEVPRRAWFRPCERWTLPYGKGANRASAGLLSLLEEPFSRRDTDSVGQIEIAGDRIQVSNGNGLDERKRDGQRNLRVLDERHDDARIADPLTDSDNLSEQVLVEVPQPAERLDLRKGQTASLQDRPADEPVGVSDQNAALLLPAAVGELDLLRNGHHGDPPINRSRRHRFVGVRDLGPAGDRRGFLGGQGREVLGRLTLRLGKRGLRRDPPLLRVPAPLPLLQDLSPTL